VIWKPRSRSQPLPTARLPDRLRVYAIGDIHGRADLLADVFERIDAESGQFPADRSIHVFLGDYVDRGPFSRDVLDLLISRAHQYPAVFLKGNHESYFVEFLKSPEIFADWRLYGGLDTILSYGLGPSLAPDEKERIVLATSLNRALPEAHRQFLNGLRLSFTCGDFFFVHAGVRPGVALKDQHEEDLLWIREDFLLHEDVYEKFIIHGHTPVMQPDVRPNRINIDTGAYATGRLTCLVIEGDKLRFL
jgi:serine/threonine protein phosphatase 1